MIERYIINKFIICGLNELSKYTKTLGITHIISILDPKYPYPTCLETIAKNRITLYFHDIIESEDGGVMPNIHHMYEIFHFGKQMEKLMMMNPGGEEGKLLIHCHEGVSRSTAAMLSLIAQAFPLHNEDSLYATLRQIRPCAWPNLTMIELADKMLNKNGSLIHALGKHYAYQLKTNPTLCNMIRKFNRMREMEMAETIS